MVFANGGTVLVAKKFVRNCFKDKDMDVKASAFIDSSAEVEQGFFPDFYAGLILVVLITDDCCYYDRYQRA